MTRPEREAAVNMPELPEIENVVRALRADLEGARLGRVRYWRRGVVYGVSRSLDGVLRGRVVEAVGRTGKRIEIRLSGDMRMYAHLGMTGHLAVLPAGEEWAPHTHLCVDLAGREAQLRFRDVRRFGGIWLRGAHARHRGRPLPAAGPDVLALGLRRFREVMRRPRQIKALFLDQRALAGMGNIYCDEVLFRCGVHPLRKASTLRDDDVKRLYQCVRRVLHAAIRSGGSTVRDYRGARNERGAYQRRHQVYGRAGQRCYRCGAVLVRMQAAGRGTVICPCCQPSPT
ncbi:MAG: bifunctional DNA-formamidopyrimidine glycosylase/DNA-(apurinic or apyrimidinic site) lyase [Phycisphaerales bacterium]|nr:MAG: bifunctional DNA-formamidopyrimidine glycosylase/DNA-(apurinic or apyrimidinic site) lyase [Phycisphaerales bacterium]